jgi:two-component system sensor histidine kinase PhcS
MCFSKSASPAVKSNPPESAQALDAYAEYENRITRRHLEVGCLLVMVLMPLGALLDYYVYHDHVWSFLGMRFLCSLLEGLLLLSLRSRVFVWQNFHRQFGLVIAMLPVVFICWMIYATDGPLSPYYAGINLILLAIAFIMRWSVDLSVFASCLVLGLYLVACLAHGPIGASNQGVFINNIYFLVLTSVIVVVGSQLHRALRVREFALRFELDQNKRILEVSNQKLDDQNKELADTIQKLTEAESQLVQSEKMASLGRMSAGIIHEINNPLNFATTGLFTLKKKAKHIAPEQQEEYNDILKDVEDGILRVKNIVSDLRMFTHPNTDHLDQVEASEVVASALRFLSNEMKTKATIEVKLDAHQTVRANKNKLIHVFVNLVQNSLDAMKEKQFSNDEKPTIWIEGRDGKEAGCLIVRDNGPGISSEHIDKIFDPFYTTKDVGAGMGLGLSICYRIMQECQGRISVRTESGKFCEFTLEFPKQP